MGAYNNNGLQIVNDTLVPGGLDIFTFVRTGDQQDLPDSLLLELPVVGTVAAGVPIEAIENLEGHLAVPASIFTERPTYLLRVRGDSMRDAGILDGDLIAIRRTDNTGQANMDGRIVVARVDNEVTVKRLKLDKDRVGLMPENPVYEPLFVAPDNLVVEGLFVGLVRNQKVLH